MTIDRRDLPAVFLTSLWLLTTGCGAPSTIAPLSGEVRFEGKPLEFGGVMLQPVEGGQPSTAVIQPDGSFVMEVRGVGPGATIGLNRVRVTCYPAQRPGNTGPANQELALGKSLIPTRYTSFGSSDLTVDVLSDENEPFIIELTRHLK